MLPHVGQGANEATEDGIALATILAHAEAAAVLDAHRSDFPVNRRL
jgi:2-polyprenyl-6-methoxyphenol hydroxylase-like FAD-dependent oxidoreductase